MLEPPEGKRIMRTGLFPSWEMCGLECQHKDYTKKEMASLGMDIVPLRRGSGLRNAPR